MEHDPHGWRTWVVIGPRLCHVHLKSACLGCLAKLQTFNGGGRPRSEHLSYGTALSISTSAEHYNQVDPEEWLHHATKHDMHDACAGQDVQFSFVTKTSVRAVPWRSSRDGPPGSRAKTLLGTTPHLFPCRKQLLSMAKSSG